MTTYDDTPHDLIRGDEDFGNVWTDPTKFGPVFLDDVVTELKATDEYTPNQPEFAKFALPPYATYMHAIHDEVIQHTTDEAKQDIQEQLRALELHSLIRADDYFDVKVLLPGVTMVKHKLALFEAAVLCNNMAAAEVMVAYDMGDVLERELQANNDLYYLANLLSLKITAGIDVYTNASKLASLSQIVDPDSKIRDRMVKSLLADGDVATARTVAGKFLNEEVFDLIDFLLEQPNLPRKEAAQRRAKLAERFQKHRSIDKETSKHLDEALKRSVLVFQNGAWKSNIQTAPINKMAHIIMIVHASSINGAITRDESQQFYCLSAGPNLEDAVSYIMHDTTFKSLREYQFQGVNKIVNAGAGDASFAAELDKALYAYTQPVSDEQVAPSADQRAIKSFAMYKMACELVAARANLHTMSDELANIYGALSVLEAERQPSLEHFHKIDFYSRTIEERRAINTVVTCRQSALAMTNPIEQYDALKRILRFCSGGWFNLDQQRAELEKAILVCRSRFTHPLIQSIVGVEPIEQ